MTGQVTWGLTELAQASGDVLVSDEGALGVAVGGLSYDSRTVERGDLFFCVPGIVADGHEFARAAVDAGVSALVVERSVGLEVPEIVVRDTRVAMARMAAAFYGRPADELMLLGVTGTNGKTTTVWLLESILRAAGHTTGLIGTIETRIGDARQPGVRTTPDSLDLQRLFSHMRTAGVGAVAMEVTSHALVLHRVEGVRYRAAAFTNLSQDHLDFHSDMDDYFAAKRELFVTERAEAGAVNVDDKYGRRLKTEATVNILGFGLSLDADVRAEKVRSGPWGQEFTALTPAGDVAIKTPLVGTFNLSNCLAACATALQAGIDGAAISKGLADVAAVPGRFEAVDMGQPFAVVVDYAHTPDSLDNVLTEARRMVSSNAGRVICTFGCGGDRDKGKRPLMGSVAARLADVVIVTSDNPRSEDPMAIIGQILEGVDAERAAGADDVIEDRRAAIHRAVALAAANDVVVIAGKGHETGQQLADRTVPFDDRGAAREALRAAGWEVVT